MTIWLLALLFVALGCGAGRNLGAIRVLIGTFGVLLATQFALPISSMLKGPLGQIGITNPLVRLSLPPLLVIVLFVIIFNIIAQVVHQQISVYYRYKVVDDHRIAWERLNEKLGIALGGVSAIAYFLLICNLIFALGYVTVQFQSATKTPTSLQLLNRARADLRSTGVEKVAAVVDPVPKGFYHGTDVLGLLYHNPALRDRLGAYPAFLGLYETPEYQFIFQDPEFNRILNAKLDLLSLLENTNVIRMVKSPLITKQLEQVDVKDLREFLETGKSPKYAEQKLLGRWELFPAATVIQVGRVFPRTGNWPVEWARFKALATAKLPDIVMLVGADGQFIIKATNVDLKQLTTLVSGRVPQEFASATVLPPPGTQKTVGKGDWKKDGDTYAVTLKTDGFEKTGKLKMVNDESMVIELPEGSMTFIKVD